MIWLAAVKRLAIVTLCIGIEAEEMGRVSHPRLERYAARCSAAFVVMRGQAGAAGAYFEKARASELFARYDRIALLDTDVLVSDRCPNLFEVVPKEMFGAWLESGEYDRSHPIREVCAALGAIAWERDYFNSGVMVLSASHADALRLPFGMYEDPWYSEQTVLNYNVRRLNIPMFPLPKHFNYFAARFHSEAPRLDPFRFGAGIIHYAGTPEWRAMRIGAMQRDQPVLMRWDALGPAKGLLAATGRFSRVLTHYRGAIARRFR